MALAMRQSGEAAYPHLEAALREAEREGINLKVIVGAWTARERYYFSTVIGNSRDLLHRFDRILSRVSLQNSGDDPA